MGQNATKSEFIDESKNSMSIYNPDSSMTIDDYQSIVDLSNKNNSNTLKDVRIASLKDNNISKQTINNKESAIMPDLVKDNISNTSIDDSIIRYPNLRDNNNSKYDITDEELGEGTFAVVKKSIRRSDGKILAVKIIDKQLSKQFLVDGLPRDYIFLKDLDHPNIIKFYDLEEDSDSFFLYTDYYASGDLQTFTEPYDYLETDVALPIYQQLVNGLDYLHSRNIIHRDIKLENILIDTSSLHIVITDFGFAIYQKPGDALLTDYPGSPAYAAPELMTGKPYDGRLVDIWAIGVLLYILLTGEYPFWSEDRGDMYNQITKDMLDFTPFEYIPAECKSFINWLLEKDPKKRPNIDDIRLNSCYNKNLSNQDVLNKLLTDIKIADDSTLRSVMKYL